MNVLARHQAERVPDGPLLCTECWLPFPCQRAQAAYKTLNNPAS